jgi:hypothetical protein
MRHRVLQSHPSRRRLADPYEPRNQAAGDPQRKGEAGGTAWRGKCPLLGSSETGWCCSARRSNVDRVPPCPILYSTNPYLSLEVGELFRRDQVHVVWCSEIFDPRTSASSAPGSMVAPSSSPRAIADQLARDVRGEDTHSALIKRYRRTFRGLATNLYADGLLTADRAEELRALASRQSFRIWRPLIYVIPRASLEAAGRLQPVPPAKRAGHGPEYRITDLRRDEFDVLEWMND